MRAGNPSVRWLRDGVAAGCAAALLVLPMAASPSRADETAGQANGWDKVLQTLNLKATPADPAPEFVRKTRPDPRSLKYIEPTLPHKVSPRPVRSAAEVEAAKAALDAAQASQADAAARQPAQVVKPPN